VVEFRLLHARRKSNTNHTLIVWNRMVMKEEQKIRSMNDPRQPNGNDVWCDLLLCFIYIVFILCSFMSMATVVVCTVSGERYGGFVWE
jgi:hypothetical protein